MNEDTEGALHHIELWVPNLERAQDEWGWLLSSLGYGAHQRWTHGVSWMLGATYIVLEESPDLGSRDYLRTAPGLNHLAFHAGNRHRVDGLVVEAAENGWTELFPEKYPHAGGPGHYAAYLVNSDGFEVELVARELSRTAPQRDGE